MAELSFCHFCIGVTGFEPAASSSRTMRSSQTEPYPEKLPTTIISCQVEKIKSFFQNLFSVSFIKSLTPLYASVILIENFNIENCHRVVEMQKHS